jgi:hypothetical protein
MIVRSRELPPASLLLGIDVEHWFAPLVESRKNRFLPKLRRVSFDGYCSERARSEQRHLDFLASYG